MRSSLQHMQLLPVTSPSYDAKVGKLTHDERRADASHALRGVLPHTRNRQRLVRMPILCGQRRHDLVDAHRGPLAALGPDPQEHAREGVGQLHRPEDVAAPSDGDLDEGFEPQRGDGGIRGSVGEVRLGRTPALPLGGELAILLPALTPGIFVAPPIRRPREDNLEGAAHVELEWAGACATQGARRAWWGDML